MRAFIVRPFGVKSGVDFDRVERQLIAPALDRLGVTGRTTGEIKQQGNIRSDMFQRLVTAGLVVADLSIHNANVFYELGIRHAMRDKRTFLIRARVDDVPFDLKTDRYLAYDAENPADALEALVDGLRATLRSEAVDSPVFQLLPALTAQDPEVLLAVPRDFQGAVAAAASGGHVGDLVLLAGEAAQLGFEWERAGLRLVARRQTELAAWEGARRSWLWLLEDAPNDAEANLRLGTLEHRLGDLDASDRALRHALDTGDLGPSDRAEAHALLGRNAKSRWSAEWRAAGGDQRHVALQSPWLRRAIEGYARGFSCHLNHYYSGINALALVTILLDLAGDMPDVWSAAFPDDARAEVERADLEGERRRLDGAVALALRAADDGEGDVWHGLTVAEHALLTGDPPRPGWVENLYRRALAGADPFARSSAAAQLALYRELRIRSACVEAALACTTQGDPVSDADEMKTTPPRHVLLFTGHRIDAPDRSEPRFPASAEETARRLIRSAVEARVAAAGGDPAALVGIASGASGGDLLFHEVCGELGVATEVYLAMPRDGFVRASVADAGPGWVERFDRLLAARPHRVLSPEADLPSWLQGASGAGDYSVWQRTNLWMLANALATAADPGHLTLVALWDGRAGDGPGGTEHMVDAARRRGAHVVVLDAGELV